MAEVSGKVKYLNKPERIRGIPAKVAEAATRVSKKYAFRANDYYLSLIDWNNPDDPIKKIIIPSSDELIKWGRLDASNESFYTVAEGVEHKYADTALLLATNVCGGYCRFCFRKRLFLEENDETVLNIRPVMEYIRGHKEITNVLLTGGDPLMLSTSRLKKMIAELRSLDHINIIRIGTKMPAFNPFRILDDAHLLNMIKKYSLAKKRIYVIVHFNHPRELTDHAVKAVYCLQKAGAIVCNQTPILKGINDDPDVLSDLLKKLSFFGIPPYYVFQGRPTEGNLHFSLPVERSLEIFELARSKCSGLARRARLVMSHSTGKIEIVGRTRGRVYFHYHRAADPDDKTKFMVFKSNKNARWFDDYEEIIREYSIKNPYRCFGPD